MISNMTAERNTTALEARTIIGQAGGGNRRSLFGRVARLAPVLGFALMAAAVGSTGCIGNPDDEGQVDPSEQGLARGGGSVGNSYDCSSGTCWCDKSIENDCENMSGVCTDATVDALINCINGWLTTHCSCAPALVSPPKTRFPIRGVTTGGNLTAAR